MSSTETKTGWYQNICAIQNQAIRRFSACTIWSFTFSVAFDTTLNMKWSKLFLCICVWISDALSLPQTDLYLMKIPTAIKFLSIRVSTGHRLIESNHIDSMILRHKQIDLEQIVEDAHQLWDSWNIFNSFSTTLNPMIYVGAAVPLSVVLFHSGMNKVYFYFLPQPTFAAEMNGMKIYDARLSLLRISKFQENCYRVVNFCWKCSITLDADKIIGMTGYGNATMAPWNSTKIHLNFVFV